MTSIFTIGHSTHEPDAFLALLRGAGIELLVDVRRFPSSRRFPWFGRAELERSLRETGVGYEHLAGLGGRPDPESKTCTAPASRSSCSAKPPVSTATVSTPARWAASQSKVESPTITAFPPPAFSTATDTRSGSGLVASTSADVVQPSAMSRASRR